MHLPFCRRHCEAGFHGWEIRVSWMVMVMVMVLKVGVHVASGVEGVFFLGPHQI
jgi:hypothetical protein